MRVVVESVHELLHVLVDHGVLHYFAIPLFQLFLRGKFAVQQQVSDFQKSAVLGQLLDGIAAIPQDAGVAVQVGDGAVAGRGVHEGRIVGHQAEILRPRLDLAQVHGAHGAVGNRNGIGLVGPVVGDG